LFITFSYIYFFTNLDLQLLESKIAEAKQKKDTLKARAQSAKYKYTQVLLIF
jgi:hypothetical protein